MVHHKMVKTTLCSVIAKISNIKIEKPMFIKGLPDSVARCVFLKKIIIMTAALILTEIDILIGII